MKYYAIAFASLVLVGAGCGQAPTDPAELSYHEVVMPKIDFAAEVPETWEESAVTANPKGPADYHEFIVPPRKDDNDKVVGTLGFRLVPRIADNELQDELDDLKPFVSESAGSEGVFDPYTEVTIAGEPGLQMKWQGITKNDVEEIWYYSFAFIGDNLLVSYFFDEVSDVQILKPVYDRALQTVEKR